MKKKISISVEDKTIDKIKIFVSKGSFRNTSHVFEYAVNRFLMEGKNGDQ